MTFYRSPDHGAQGRSAAHWEKYRCRGSKVSTREGVRVSETEVLVLKPGAARFHYVGCGYCGQVVGVYKNGDVAVHLVPKGQRD